MRVGVPAFPIPFAAVLVMAGSGSRFGGGVPKVFARLEGRPLWTHSARTLAGTPGCRYVVLVAAQERLGQVAAEAQEHLDGEWCVTAGGARRQDSVRHGLAMMADMGGPPAVVAIHDAARPLVTRDEILDAVAAAHEHGASLVAVPARDTVKEVDREGRVVDTPDRTRMWLAQTPQCFRPDLLVAAHEEAAEDGIAVTDDAALVERMGVPVRVVRGGPWNLKVTEPTDLAVAETVLAGRRERGV